MTPAPNPARAALSRAVNRAIAQGAPVYVNQPALSDAARAALAWCDANSPVAKYGDIAGKRVVQFGWIQLAQAMGLESCWPHKPIGDALDELHRAGLLAYHDHGPATYGHTSTIYVGADMRAYDKPVNLLAAMQERGVR